RAKQNRWSPRAEDVTMTSALPVALCAEWGALTMGIDLKVLASHFREHRGDLLSTASLRFDRDMRFLSLFSQQADPCIVQPLPHGTKIGHYEDQGLRFDEKDRYGNPLTFTTPEQLEAIRDINEISDWNRAVMAFLFALPSGTRIVLYWC